jgi:hypothetical protein
MHPLVKNVPDVAAHARLGARSRMNCSLIVQSQTTVDFTSTLSTDASGEAESTTMVQLSPTNGSASDTDYNYCELSWIDPVISYFHALQILRLATIVAQLARPICIQHFNASHNNLSLCFSTYLIADRFGSR